MKSNFVQLDEINRYIIYKFIVVSLSFSHVDKCVCLLSTLISNTRSMVGGTLTNWKFDLYSSSFGWLTLFRQINFDYSDENISAPDRIKSFVKWIFACGGAHEYNLIFHPLDLYTLYRWSIGARWAQSIFKLQLIVCQYRSKNRKWTKLHRKEEACPRGQFISGQMFQMHSHVNYYKYRQCERVSVWIYQHQMSKCVPNGYQ